MPNGQQEITVRANKDQLVVNLEQLNQVLAILEPIEVSWSSVRKSEALRLALITLDNVSVPTGYTGAAGKPDLDRLVAYLRKVYKDETGKALTIGKNRIVGSLVGSPYTGGGEGLPAPYTGGGLTAGPYSAAGNPPYTGGGLQGIQLMPLTGTLPKRAEPPGAGVGVGILDTRIFAHPDLDGRYLASADALASACPERPPDQEAHATFIAGVVLTWAPNANLMVGRVLNENDVSASSWQVATKMAEFAKAGVDVLNISFGAATEDNKPPLVLQRAVQVLGERGVIVVAAAGNNGPDTREIWPAALATAEPNVVAVGAGKPSSSGGFASTVFSPDAPWVDLIAPGENVYSTYKASGYATWSGTSFAAAAVSGAIALLVQTQNLDAAQALDWLRTPPAMRKQPGVGAVIDDIGPR